jgi:hypothetical protein
MVGALLLCVLVSCAVRKLLLTKLDCGRLEPFCELSRKNIKFKCLQHNRSFRVCRTNVEYSDEFDDLASGIGKLLEDIKWCYIKSADYKVEVFDDSLINLMVVDHRLMDNISTWTNDEACVVTMCGKRSKVLEESRSTVYISSTCFDISTLSWAVYKQLACRTTGADLSDRAAAEFAASKCIKGI